MLVTQTSGLDSQANPFGSRDPDGGERFARDVLPTIPFVAEPGKLYNYSNPGVALAGHVAATVYGKPFGTMMQELLFDPLGMERSTFDPLVALTYPFALSHDLEPDGTLRVARPIVESTGQHPAGFAMTTVLDLANFAIMQMGQGRFRGQPILEPETVAEMHKLCAPHLTIDGKGYGITFTVGSYKGRKRVEHGGGIHNYHCSFDMLPEDRVAVILIGSRPAPPGVHLAVINQIFDQVLGLPGGLPETPEPVVVEPDRAEWPGLVGQYLSRLWGLLTVAITDDGLTLQGSGQRMQLEAHSDGVYFWRRPDGKGTRSVGFVPEPPGVPCQYLMLDGWTARRFEPDPAFVPDRALWERWTGVYISPATGREDVRLWVGEDGRLWAKVAWIPGQEFPCTPLNSDTEFACGAGLFRMEDGVLEINGWRLPKAAA